MSKKPVDTPLTQVTGLYSSSGQVGGQVDVSRRFGAGDQFGLRANLAGRAGEAAVEDLDEDDRVGHLAFNWWRPGVNLDIQYGYYRTKITDGVSGYFIPAGVPIPRAPDGSKVSGPAWDTRMVEGEFVRSALDVELAEGWSAFAVLGASRSEELFVGLTPTVLNAAGNASGSPFAQQGKSDWGDAYNVDVGVRGRFRTGPVGHAVRLSYGLIYGKSDFTDIGIDPNFVQPPINIYDPRSYGAGSHKNRYWRVFSA